MGIKTSVFYYFFGFFGIFLVEKFFFRYSSAGDNAILIADGYREIAGL